MRASGYHKVRTSLILIGLAFLLTGDLVAHPGIDPGESYVNDSNTNFFDQADLFDQPESPLLARLLNIDPESPPDIVIFLGRFHPLFVHLPISFILLALFIEVLSRFKRFAELKPSVSLVLLLGFISALFATTAGLLLSLSGDYSGSTLSWHKWAGIGVTITAGIAYFFKRKMRSNPSAQTARVYGSVLTLSCATLIFASHYGGSLTHGADYLTSYMPEPMRSWAGIPPRDESNAQIVLTNLEEAHVYESIISPILEAKCNSCHNAQKSKGDLILTSQMDIIRGGENGSVIEAGSSASSELIRRVTLEDGHEDLMPPDGRKPLSDDHIRLMSWWVDSGASFESFVAETDMPDDVKNILDRMVREAEEEAMALKVPPADPDAIAALSEIGVLILPLSQETNLLQAQFLNVVDGFSDQHLDLLLPLSQQITWLDLGRTTVTDDGMEVIGKLTNLNRLHLENTSVTDDGLIHLQGLQNLKYLNLYGTSITDAGLLHLNSLKELKSLYLWQTNTTEEGATRLKKEIPDLYINQGWNSGAFSD